jgi:four helix bundle protein
MVMHYRELIAWQRAMDLAQLAYETAALLPDSERFGLRSQIQRSAVSVPANIAEGHERRSGREYRRYLAIASASLAELETHLLLIERIGLLAHELIQPVLECATEVGKLIRGIDRGIVQRLNVT